MDADQEKAFDDLCMEASASLWPGRIQIDGVEYAVSLTRTEVEVEFRDGDQAGLKSLEGINIELSKDLYPDELPNEKTIKDLATGKLFRLKRLGGRNETDRIWFLECVIDD